MEGVAGGAGAGAPEAAPTCAWCGTPAADGARSCASCGAALAQRESIGDLAIPGLTAVDAALQDFDKRPLHLRGPSPTQGMAPALIVGAVAGGPIGLAAIGGVAAVAATEFLGARRPGDGALENVGRPSEVAVQAIQRIDDGTLSSLATATSGTAAEAAPADDGRSIWDDLPPVAPAYQIHDEPDQDEEGAGHGR